MKIDRRQFLKSLALGTGLASATTIAYLERLRADENAPAKQRFVFVELRGAHDQLLGIDPRDPIEFSDANIPTTGIQLGLNLLAPQYANTPIKTVAGIDFGPAVPQSFADLAPKMCIGRGFTMDTLAHQVGRLYWSTGRTPSGLNPTAASISSQIVEQIAATDPSSLGLIPNLSIGANVHSFATDPKLRPFQVRNADEMTLALTLGADPISKLVLDEIGDELFMYRHNTTICDPAGLDAHGGKLSTVRASQFEVEAIIASGLSASFNLFPLGPPTQEIIDLALHYGYSDVNDASAIIAVAAQALKLDMSRCITVQFAESLDDHDGSWAEDQPADQWAAFDAVAKLYDDLSQTPCPDNPSVMMNEVTTIVMGSDFSRTPLLNTKQGRDHWPVNSCVVIGGGMPQGRVIGASSHHGMESRPIDPQTGASVDPGTSGSFTLNPGHWMASLMDNCGYSIADLREDPVPCLKA